MLILAITLILLLGYYLLHQLASVVLLMRRWGWGKPLKHVPEADLPFISILLAARNEEATILRCLQHLAELDYPLHKLQILLGNDHSTDRTGELMLQFISAKPQFQYYSIDQTLPGLKGKQNVLAQLAHKATGSLYLITDADIAVPSQWARAMVASFDKEKIGLVASATTVEGPGFFTALQRIDWLFGFASFQALAEMDRPVTVAGNNMAISRKAYEAVGGYENLRFSLTEDYLLFSAVIAKGYRMRAIFRPEALNLTLPIHGLTNFLHQRKRWMKGGAESPLYAALLLGMYFILTPAWLVSVYMLPIAWLVAAIALKVLGDLLLLTTAHICLKPAHALRSFFIFPLWEVYATLCWAVLPLYWLLPIKVNWKGRTF